MLAILQARMTSTRLPGKVLADILGQPMILRQLERLRRSRHIQHFVVATTDDPSDDPLAAWLFAEGQTVFRGAMNDVLDRFIGAIDQHADGPNALRLTADCPLADPNVIDLTIERHLTTGADYTSNTGVPRSYPKGLDVEVFNLDALRLAHRETRDPYDREHVTPFLYRHPERFRIAVQDQNVVEGDVRWTVDRPDDLDFVRQIYAALYPQRPNFESEDIRQFVRQNPDLLQWGGDRRA